MEPHYLGENRYFSENPVRCVQVSEALEPLHKTTKLLPTFGAHDSAQGFMQNFSAAALRMI